MQTSVRIVAVVLIGLAGCTGPAESTRAAGVSRGTCVGASLCTGDECFAPDDMISILACQCNKLDATCGMGACEKASYCEGKGCDEPSCFAPDTDVSRAMCAQVKPDDCQVVSNPAYCAGASLCQGSSCYATALPISEVACACGLINPACGMGQCVDGGGYCEGTGCPYPVCYAPTSTISLAMCGGIPLTGCAVTCAAAGDEVAFWPLDETRTTSAYSVEWNPDAQSGTSRATFGYAIQYLPPQRGVAALAFSDDWSGYWFKFGSTPETVRIELFDSTVGASGAWVAVLSQPFPGSGAVVLAGKKLTFPALGVVTAIRIAGYTSSNTPSPNNYFMGFGSGTMYLSGAAALRPKDLAARNNGTASDTLQYFTASGPAGPSPAPGKVRGALDFDGIGDVVVAPLHFDEANPGIRATHDYTNLTIDAWIDPTQLHQTPRAILAFVATNPGALGYALALDGSELSFTAAFTSGTVTATTTGAAITAGAWHHVAVVAGNGSGVTFYVDGAQVGAPTPYVVLGPVAAEQWQIGSAQINGGPTASSFHGRIDEVKVHDRPLAASEIAQVYAAGPSGTCQRGLLMTSPHNGQVFEGANAGRAVPVEGYSTVAGQAVAIEAYDTSSGIWSPLATTTAASSTDATGMYPWSTTVTPVPSAAYAPFWEETGLGWLRVVSGATVDDPLCLPQNQSASLTGRDLVTNCRGDLGSMATLADSDRAGQLLFNPPVNPRLEPSSTGSTMPGNSPDRYLWKKVYQGTVAPSPALQVGNNYYNVVDANASLGDARATLAGWKAVNGFPSANEVKTVYFNAGDLRIGREMHCREVKACDGSQPVCSGQQCNTVIRKACYVTNYFELSGAPFAITAPPIGVGGPAGVALDHAINQTDPRATVSMEALDYKPGSFNCATGTGLPPLPANRVRFYVHETFNGVLLTDVALDSDGVKRVPGVCLTCHGGGVPSNGSTDVIGANFIPFDVGSFFYASLPGYTYTNQEDKFRQLNALVLATGPTAGITDLINGFYRQEGPTGAALPGVGVTFPNTPANFDYTPRGWAGYEPTYEHVPRRSCRTCHLSQGPAVQWLSFPQIQLSAACPVPLLGTPPYISPYMPQAEVPFKDFWRHGHRADLVNATMSFDACAP